MLKIIGVIALALTVFWVGRLFSQKVKYRVGVLEQTVRMLVCMENEIRYGNTDVLTMSERIARMEGCDRLCFLSHAAEQCKAGEPFEKAWKNQLNLCAGEMSLNGDEIGQLMMFGEVLGTTDVEGQMKNISLYQEFFQEALHTAREEAAIKGKLYQSLSLLASAAVIILAV